MGVLFFREPLAMDGGIWYHSRRSNEKEQSHANCKTHVGTCLGLGAVLGVGGGAAVISSKDGVMFNDILGTTIGVNDGGISQFLSGDGYIWARMIE